MDVVGDEAGVGYGFDGEDCVGGHELPEGAASREEVLVIIFPLKERKQECAE